MLFHVVAAVIPSEEYVAVGLAFNARIVLHAVPENGRIADDVGAVLGNRKVVLHFPLLFWKLL